MGVDSPRHKRLRTVSNCFQIGYCFECDSGRFVFSTDEEFYYSILNLLKMSQVEMDFNVLEKDSRALSGLFQAIVNDMKVGRW